MTVYSHSRLSTFEQCKLKFKYKYIDKVETEIETTVEAFLGGKVHDTLEKLYNDLKFEKVPEKEELLEFFEKEWRKDWNEDILIVRGEYEEQNYIDMGKRFISDYYERYHPFDQATTIGTEVRILLKLDEKGKYQVQGYIDRLDDNNGIYEIHDYKTASNLPLQHYLDEDRQLALYAIAVKENYEDAEDVKLVWHFLAFDKELDSERTDKQLEELKQETIKLIDEIEACNEFPPKTSSLCNWCEFRPICPEWKHQYEIERTRDYQDDDGVKLVDKYAKLKEEEKLLQQKLDSLKERILEFAEQKGVNAVFGTDQRAKIWSKELEKFPRRTDPRYKEFIEAVKQSGLWKEYSRIDSFKLEKAFNNKQLREEMLELLEKYTRKEKIERIYLGKK